MIYFAQENELFRNRVKIGITDNIRQRLNGLRGDSPSNLKLLLLLPGNAHNDTLQWICSEAENER